MKDKLNLISSNVKSTKPPNLNTYTIKEGKRKNSPYNKNQQSALFTFNLCWLAVGRIHPILPTASQYKRMTYTNCCVYRVVPPDDEQ